MIGFRNVPVRLAGHVYRVCFSKPEGRVLCVVRRRGGRDGMAISQGGRLGLQLVAAARKVEP